jgi:hypothetical protein
VLRTVTGTYKATLTRLVELKAAVPPLDLYLNARAAAFRAKERPPGVTDLTNRLKRDIVARASLRRAARRRAGRPASAAILRRRHAYKRAGDTLAE